MSQNDSLLDAALHCRVDEAARLIDAGADVNGADEEGWTPLMGAECADMMDLLLRRGANPRHSTELGESVLMAVSRRGSAESIRMLVTAGSLDVNASDSSGNTALMEAAVAGAMDGVVTLLELGADPSARTRSGGTAEEGARQHGHTDVARALAEARDQ